MEVEATAGKSRCNRVLIVEDDRALLELLTDYLELQGLEVTAVESGEAAMQELESGTPPDLAVLDIRMPGTRGTDVLRRIKREPRFSRVKVAVITGLGPDELELGARPDELLPKPVDVERLRAALTRMCG